MENERLERYLQWYGSYVKDFYCDDEYVNENIKLKEEHSKRVCDEMRYITDGIGLSEEQKRLADVIALFHDIGRFEQFSTYRTYRDSESVDHAAFGVEILKKYKLLDDIGDSDRAIIEKAIGMHNIMQLPDGLDDETLLHCQLIRDADKLDIFYVVKLYYKRFEEDPDGFRLELGLPDDDSFSDEIADDVIAGRRIDYLKLKNWNDMKLCQLSWIYDINFKPTFERIREKKFMEMITSFLPNSPKLQKVTKTVLAYAEKKISE